MEVPVAPIIGIVTDAAESKGLPDLFTGPMIGLIVGLVTAVAGPLVIWFLNRRGAAGKIQKLDLHLKKLEIATKLKQLEKEFGTSESLDWDPLKEEISEIISAISEEKKIQKRALGHGTKKLSFLRRVFIWYKPISIGSWILHLYFYAIVLELIMLPFTLKGVREADFLMIVLPMLLLFAFFIRMAAIYLLKKKSPENKYFG